MKEEDLIKKLKNVKLPDIELQGHQSRLRMALLDTGYLKRQRKDTIWGFIKSKVKGVKDTMIKGLVSRQPVWKIATLGILAVALVLGVTLAIPSLTADSVYAQAEEIVQNSPEVHAALGDGEVKVVKVTNIVNDEGIVIAQSETGTASAKVDLKNKKVIEVTSIPELTVADEQAAIEITKADPRVKELLDSGATIGDVSTMYICGAMGNVETGEVEEFSEAFVTVEVQSGDNIFSARVDLAAGKVVSLTEIAETSFEASEPPIGIAESFSIPDSGVQ